MAVLRYKENFVGVSNWAYELLDAEDHPNLTHLSPKGKEVHHEPKRLSKDEAKAIIEECCDLGPLHNPANLKGIIECERIMPVPQVAVFDTSFHQTMPAASYMYAIPYEYYEKYKMRRYGFHGTSHKYVSQRAAAMLGKDVSELKNKLLSCFSTNTRYLA